MRREGGRMAEYNAEQGKGRSSLSGEGKGVLEGLKALDLSESIAGLYCAKLLANLGADVVKVESPEIGGAFRHTFPYAGGAPHVERSIRHLYLNSRKKSITLNLDGTEGRSLLRQLLMDSDVIVEDLSAEGAREAGLDYESVASFNPGVVVASITFFGRTGPYKDYKGEEIVVQALSGHMDITGEPDREPLQMGGQVIQYAGGQAAFVGVLMAVYYSIMTGVGQRIDCSIMEAGIDLLDNWGVSGLSGGQSPKRVGNITPDGLLRVRGGLYECKDGWVAIGLVPGGWDEFVDMVDLDELRDPMYSDPVFRIERRNEIEAIVEPWIRERSRLEIFHASQRRRNVVGYVAVPEDMLRSEQLLERRFFEEVSHPIVGSAKYPGVPFRMGEGRHVMERAPLLGEHNSDIYTGRLGIDSGRLEWLRLNGVI